MPRLVILVLGGLIAATQFVGCSRTGAGDGDKSPSAASPASSPATTPSRTPLTSTPTATPSHASPSNASPSPRLPEGFSTAGKRGGTAPARASLLRVIRFGKHSGYDRVVFEFTGAAPAYDVRYVDEVREDPSDRPVPLKGKAFLAVVMRGGTLDTTPQVDDPAQARSYEGPRRVEPELSAVEEVAAAGDFEAVLTFGVGVDRRVAFRVLRLTEPGRIVVDVATL